MNSETVVQAAARIKPHQHVARKLPSLASSRFTLEPERNYLLSGWIKTEDVAHTTQAVDAGADLCLWGTWQHTTTLTGTNDWTYVRLVFNSGPTGTAAIGARIGYWAGVASGTAWFDDLRIRKIAEGDAHPRWKIIEAATLYGHLNVFKHEWGHSLLDYSDAPGTAPRPTVMNHTDGTQYVPCTTAQSYVWVDETDANPIPNSICEQTARRHRPRPMPGEWA